ncbi:MAG: hypothetical protein Q9183_002705 [Haloplaca sp. 2 TL-2023]
MIAPGQINRHKAQDSSTTHYPQYATSPRVPPGRGRGAHRSYPTSHSLVLNNSKKNHPATSQAPSSSSVSSGVDPLRPAPAYVTKHGRHKQLINTSVLERVTAHHKQAVEESQQRKVLTTNQWEQRRMNQYMKGLGPDYTDPVSHTAAPQDTSAHKIEIDGMRFQLQKNGSKLLRVPGPADSLRSTPKRIVVHGVTFVRSKQGNLYRSGVVGASKYVSQQPGMNAILLGRQVAMGEQVKGLIFSRSLGKANKNPSLCKRFTKTACRKKKCNLPHVDHAGQIRRLAAQSADPASTADERVTTVGNDSDISSDDDEDAGPEGEDFDSDDLEDVFMEGVDDTGHQALAEQDDFIGF